MSKPVYEHLMAPLKIRGHVLKNRMCAANSLPHFLQGPETYPADSVIAHYENKAKGAAITTCMGINNNSRGRQLNMDDDFSHFPDYDLYDTCSQNYLMHLADAIHYYHSIACMAVFVGPPSGYPIKRWIDQVKEDDASEVIPDMIADLARYEIEWLPAHEPVAWYTEELLNEICESYAEQAEILKKLGFDMISIHMCYRGNLPARFFSPITNDRTDEYGGSLENRMRFPLMVLKRVRERVGNDFIIEIEWSANDEAGGYSIADSAAFLREAKKYIDMVQIRTCTPDPAHPIGFNPEETPFLYLAEYIKKEVPDLIVGAIAGFQDLETCDRAIAEGKCDLVYAARAFISNPNYAELMVEGRNDDIVPCLRCNKCHGRSRHDPFVSVCSVNPQIGLEHKIGRMIKPSKGGKRVAIIGGGPAGMRAAMYLQERGHIPVIFEASDALGGAIKHSDVVEFKWPLRKFKNFLIHQMSKRNIEVRLNTKATPEMIATEDFDVVICALGASEVCPPIPGVREKNQVVYAQQAFHNPEQLGKNVVIIGGGEVGVECGIYLARRDHLVHVLEMRPVLSPDSTAIHYYSMFKEAWEAEPNFHSTVNATVVAVEEDCVIYRDAHGTEHQIPADSVVVSAGMRGKTDEALSFYGSAREFYMVGDCERAATIQQAMRSVYGVVNQI